MRLFLLFLLIDFVSCRNTEIKKADSIVLNSFAENILLFHSISTSSNSESSNTSSENTILPITSFEFNPASISLTQGVESDPIIPSSNGTIQSCSISPNLPTGLGMSSTCILSGMPISLLSSTNYTVTASNSLSSKSASISIQIGQAPFVSMASAIFKTGQVTSYNSFDDGIYLKGVNRTFTRGESTGLLWQRCSSGLNQDETCSGTYSRMNWDSAVLYCSNLKIGKKSWRLPNPQELTYLIDYSKSNVPRGDPVIFPNTDAGVAGYWTAFDSPVTTTHAWNVSFASGSTGPTISNKTTSNYSVRCISGSDHTTNFQDNGNETVTDLNSGLVWMKCTLGLSGTNCNLGTVQPIADWPDAITKCENASIAGRTDWRLPNINELRSLVNHTSIQTAKIDPGFFPNTQSASYWSSTTDPTATSAALIVQFSDGRTLNGTKASVTTFRVRCVTGP
jgi:hypothetical protein